jgi:hypothetical protein
MIKLQVLGPHKGRPRDCRVVLHVLGVVEKSCLTVCMWKHAEVACYSVSWVGRTLILEQAVLMVITNLRWTEQNTSMKGCIWGAWITLGLVNQT